MLAMRPALPLRKPPQQRVLSGFPRYGEETKPYGAEVTNISWPEMAEPGLDPTGL